ncbi:3,4-dihydroxy-2-butanone-4-phosphate synthase [Alteribacillus sp. JSM 102045]|uniref:3,4-dihydroxy-2-butanone-4-phosphate synthase n=1 Tax=Alteribacillus sp. JSM 102045 TaxID=1562101 RepID=UPI0035BFFEB1
MYNNLKDCILALKRGEMILLIDDCIDGREIGYFYLLSQNVSPNHINLMITHAKGLVSIVLTKKRAEELALPKMEKSNENLYKNFTISIDSKSCTTGISAFERCETIKMLIQKSTSLNDFIRPGHIFPIISRERGLVEKVSISEAATDLAKLCSSYLSGVICEVLNNEGGIANLKELKEKSIQQNLKMLSIKDLTEYQLKNTSLIVRQSDFTLPTKYGDVKTRTYLNQIDDSELIVMVGNSKKKNILPLPVYIDSGYSIGEALEPKKLEKITQDGTSVLIYRKLSNPKGQNVENRNMFMIEGWEKIIVEQILKDINITNSVVITNVA